MVGSLFRMAGRVRHRPRAPSHAVRFGGADLFPAATPPPGGRPSSHSLGEATGPVISAAIRMYGSHTSEKSMLAEGGVIERDFGKGDEERLAYSSV